MFFSQINPYIRYARYLNITQNTIFDEVVPLDARLFYTFSGHGKINVENNEYDMPPHSLLIINSGIPYKLISPEKTVTYIAVNFDYTQNSSSKTVPIAPVLKKNFSKDALLDFTEFEDTKILSDILYINKIDTIQIKLTTIVNEYMQKLLYYEQKIGHLLAECITDSIRLSEIGNISHQKESVGRIISHIRNYYNQNLTNQSIGKLFGYHPNYVSSLIKRITGMPIHQYIIYIRLMNAMNLLENTNLSIEKISEDCGFYDCAYFSKYFKKYFGISPSKYRKM